MIPLETIGERMFEWACRDGDYGLEAILRGHASKRSIRRDRASAWTPGTDQRANVRWLGTHSANDIALRGGADEIERIAGDQCD